MKKIAMILGIGLLVFAVGFLSFAGATVFSSLFFTAVAEDDGTSMTTIAAEPAVNPAASPKYESVDYGLTFMTYRVKRGDNLTDIARRHSSDPYYMLSVKKIETLNGIKNPDRILAGQKLLLPMYYAKEVQVVMPETIQAAVTAAIAPKEAALIKTKKWEFAAIAMFILSIALFIFCALTTCIYKTKGAEGTSSDSTKPETESEKFLSYSDEIRAKLQKCTGQEVADILESELVEVPRNPGSSVMNKKKLKNLEELVTNHPELLDMPLKQWSEHLAAKINRVAPASAESA